MKANLTSNTWSHRGQSASFHPGTWLLVQAGACLPGERFSYLLENQGTALKRRLEGGITGI